MFFGYLSVKNNPNLFVKKAENYGRQKHVRFCIFNIKAKQKGVFASRIFLFKGTEIDEKPKTRLKLFLVYSCSQTMSVYGKLEIILLLAIIVNSVLPLSFPTRTISFPKRLSGTLFWVKRSPWTRSSIPDKTFPNKVFPNKVYPENTLPI